MVFAIIQTPGELPELKTFNDWTGYRATRPERRKYGIKTRAAVSTAIYGTSYQSRKAQSHGILCDLANAASIPGLSMGELATIQDEAEKVARRAGLLREARENGII